LDPEDLPLDFMVIVHGPMDEEMRFHPMKQKNKKTNPMVVECRHLEWLVEDSFFFPDISMKFWWYH
jgi:hypothetical protein